MKHGQSGSARQALGSGAVAAVVAGLVLLAGADGAGAQVCGGPFSVGCDAIELESSDDEGRRRHRGGGFSFTGPAEFYADGRMTCHRAKAVMRFRLGYSDLVVHSCAGRRYHIEGRRGAVRELVTLDAFTTNPVGVRRLR